jgi:hypothetical protein
MVATLVDEVRSESRQANISHAGSAPKEVAKVEKRKSGILEACLKCKKGIQENQLMVNYSGLHFIALYLAEKNIRKPARLLQKDLL